MKKDKDNFIMLPTNDFCFKELMQNPNVRKHFIAAILGIDPKEIKETILLPSETRKGSEDEKQGILDVRVLLMNGTQMNIEIQVARFAYWDKRIVFYMSKMFTDQLKAGDSYRDLKKVIHVSILDFIHIPDDDRPYRTLHICDTKTGKMYTDIFEFHILELPKLSKVANDEDSLIQWMKFLGGKKREEFEAMAMKNEAIKEAYQDLQRLSANDKKRVEYATREKALLDYTSQIVGATEEGRLEGIRIGEERGIQAMIHSLRFAKLDDEFIIDRLMQEFSLTEEKANEYLK